jgi:hypothetical protein
MFLDNLPYANNTTLWTLQPSAYLLFLKYPAIPPTNNPAEQGIRNAVLSRKKLLAI